MSPPQISFNQITWNLSESNLEINFAPFYHCQGVPIIITKITSLGLNSSYFQITEDKIIVKYKDSSRILNEAGNQRNLQSNKNV